MLRQRIRTRTSPLALLGLLPLLLLALALIWYGAMTMLLAAKVSPASVNTVSGYRSLYDFLSGLAPADITPRVRLVTGLAGIATFLTCSFLAWKSLARPYLSRSELPLAEDARGLIVAEPRAVERAAEGAARRHPAVSSAAGRHTSGRVALNVELRRAQDAAETMRDVQRRARVALQEHGLPALPIDVTLTGLDRKKGRDLK
jgi:hypothetical protein